MDGIEVKLVETEEEMEAAMGVRFRVFVAEQQVPRYSLIQINDAYGDMDKGEVGRGGFVY